MSDTKASSAKTVETYVFFLNGFTLTSLQYNRHSSIVALSITSTSLLTNSHAHSQVISHTYVTLEPQGVESLAMVSERTEGVRVGELKVL